MFIKMLENLNRFRQMISFTTTQHSFNRNGKYAEITDKINEYLDSIAYGIQIFRSKEDEDDDGPIENELVQARRIVSRPTKVELHFSRLFSSRKKKNSSSFQVQCHLRARPGAKGTAERAPPRRELSAASQNRPNRLLIPRADGDRVNRAAEELIYENNTHGENTTRLKLISRECIVHNKQASISNKQLPSWFRRKNRSHNRGSRAILTLQNLIPQLNLIYNIKDKSVGVVRVNFTIVYDELTVWFPRRNFDVLWHLCITSFTFQRDGRKDDSIHDRAVVSHVWFII